jgi:hypothetical protein
MPPLQTSYLPQFTHPGTSAEIPVEHPGVPVTGHPLAVCHRLVNGPVWWR